MNKNVRHMTSDRFYDFEGEELLHQLEHPQGPQKNRLYRQDYTEHNGTLHIKNGCNLFNRPLCTPGGKSCVTAGDRPAVILWTNNHYQKRTDVNWGVPDLFGYFYPAVRCGETSKWLHAFSTCETTYHPGWIAYQMRDETFDGLEIGVTIVPHKSGAVYIAFRITCAEGADAPELVWTHGCLTYQGDSPWKDSYDPNSILVPWDKPEAAADNTVELTESAAVIRSQSDSRNWASVASSPKSFFQTEICAKTRLELSPTQALNTSPAGFPCAAGVLKPAMQKSGEYEACITLLWGRDCDPSAELLPLAAAWKANVQTAIEEYAHRCEAIKITTPDQELDTLFAFLATAADAMWLKPGIRHCVYSWGGITPLFRTYYGLTCCGDHVRIASALRFHAQVDEEGALKNLAGSPEEKPGVSGYEPYGSTIDMLWHHYLWTGDKEILRQWLPIIDALLKRIECKWRDKNGLYQDYLTFWASDSFEYTQGCTVATTFAWRMYRIRGLVALELGEPADVHFEKALAIKRALEENLWCEEEGFFYDTRFPSGEVIPSPIAPAIYHPIEFDLVEGENAHRMLHWLISRLTSDFGMVRVDDWTPINWSHNVYSQLETANAAIAAYHIGRDDVAWKMLTAIKESALRKVIVPGSICCVSSSAGIAKNSTDFGDGVSLVIKAVVEGMFGIGMNVPSQHIDIAPAFPVEWESAEISLPDIPLLRYRKIHVQQEGQTLQTITLELETKGEWSKSVLLPLTGEVVEASVNGGIADFTIINRNGKAFVMLDIGKGTAGKIQLRCFADGAQEAVRAFAADKPPQHVWSPYHAQPTAQNAVPLDISPYTNLAFHDIHHLFAQELTWQFDVYGECWTSKMDEQLVRDRKVTVNQIAYPISNQVVAVWQAPAQREYLWKNERKELCVPNQLVIDVNRSAEGIALLYSGLCTPMSCFLPQVRITIRGKHGEVTQYDLCSPDTLDFVAQHTTDLPAVQIGTLKPERVFNNLSASATGVLQQLHADAIYLKTNMDFVESITAAALRENSGMVLYSVITV